ARRTSLMAAVMVAVESPAGVVAVPGVGPTAAQALNRPAAPRIRKPRRVWDDMQAIREKNNAQTSRMAGAGKRRIARRRSRLVIGSEQVWQHGDLQGDRLAGLDVPAGRERRMGDRVAEDALAVEAEAGGIG